ncbi:MAG: hypothetical protein IJW37_01460 [Lachnospiraceae bacterium]|nr:hypothetical protein [Lachnospiraceae bacterium]
MRYFCFALILLFAASFSNCEGYVPRMTKEEAIEAALADGQKYFVGEFNEWQTWEVRTAEFQVVELVTLFEKEHDSTMYIWHVEIGKEDGSRSVHFVVKDRNREVVGGWNSIDTVVDYKEQPREKYQFSAEEVIIRAILYEDANRNNRTQWRHLYVYLDNFGTWDSAHLSSQYRIPYERIKLKVPLGQQAWRIRFCMHEGEHDMFDMDIEIIVGALNGKVYGYWVLNSM